MKQSANWTNLDKYLDPLTPHVKGKEKLNFLSFVRNNVRNIPYWINSVDMDEHNKCITHMNYEFLEKRKKLKEEITIEHLL